MHGNCRESHPTPSGLSLMMESLLLSALNVSSALQSYRQGSSPPQSAQETLPQNHISKGLEMQLF